jgi:hypothetical protein
MAVVGEREAAGRQVSIRMLRGDKSQLAALDQFLQRLRAEPLPS